MVETIVAVDPKLSAQILLDGAQEILGIETMSKVIARLSPAQEPSGSGTAYNFSPIQPGKFFNAGAFFKALEEIYGTPGRRGLALRIGRATFRSVLKYFGDQAGFRTMEYRLLPAPRRVERGLRALAQILAEQTASKIVVSEDETSWLWHVQPGPISGKNQSGDQDCFLITGLLQEFTTWAGGGRFYRIVETECRENGSQACLYRIERKPLD